MIEIKNIYKSFGKIDLLKGIDLTIAEGETVALMGPSGGGKSVLLKIVTGLVAPDQGEVIIDGKNVTKTKGRALDSIREHVGMIFQGNALFDSMNVGDNVAFALKAIKGLTQEDISRMVEEALNMVKLGAIEGKRIWELSGGMKKRVSIARAIIANPRILLTDDPTAGLDPVTSAAITNLLAELKKNFKSTGIIVTNALSTARAAADKVAFLYEGKILEYGPYDEVMGSSHEPIRKFVEYSPEAPAPR